MIAIDGGLRMARRLAALVGVVGGLAGLALGGGVAVAAPVEHAENGSVTIDLGGFETSGAVARQPGGKIVLAGGRRVQSGQSTFFDDAVVSRLNLNGTADTTFAGTGNRFIDLGGNERFHAVAVQPDGKILAAGNDDLFASNSDVLVCRFNADGTLDTSFDGDGIKTIDSGDFDSARALVVQSDGKIVLAGRAASSADVVVYRLNPNGTMDTTFDADGTRTIDVGGGEEAFAVALQRNGKIVIAGRTLRDGFDVLVCRLNPDGTLDASFDGDGVRTIDSSERENAFAVALQGDGKIVVAGETGVDNEDAVVHRLNPDGTMDASFDGDGTKTIIDSGPSDAAHAIAVQSDGKIVAAGRQSTGNGDAVVHRLNPDGTMDATFDGDGTKTVDRGAGEIASAMVLQPDGRIVAAGARSQGSNADLLAFRLNADGAFDGSFDSDGAVAIDSGGLEEARAAVRQPDGKIVLAGRTDGDAVAYRVNPTDGTLDTAFDGDGEKRIDSGGTELVFAVARQADGKLVLAGRTSVNGDAIVYRLNPDGSPDATFGSGGTVRIDEGGTEESRGVAIQADGKIVLAGSSSNGLNGTVHRLNPDGTRDTTFGGDGEVGLDLGGNEQAFAVAVQRNARIVVAGSTSVAGNAVVYRFNPNGSFDLSFGVNGVKRIDSGGTEAARAVAVQLDGKIVLAGSTTVNNDAAVYRLNADGSMDSTFDGDGARGIDSGGVEQANAVAIQNNGAIIIAGSTSILNDAAVYRLTPTGAPDTTLDLDGARGHDNGGTETAFAIAGQPDGKIVLAGHTTAGNDALAYRLNQNGAPDTTFDDGIPTPQLAVR